MKLNKQKQNGFRILIQSNLTDIEKKEAFKFVNEFIKRVKENNGSWNFWSRGGHKSYLARNNFGYLLNPKNPNLVFRRISNRKREFAIVKTENLLNKENEAGINSVNKCPCPICLGSKKVKWKNNVKPNFEFYYEEGLV
jgi:hypothetical protein